MRVTIGATFLLLVANAISLSPCASTNTTSLGQTFYINLDSRPDRREFMELRLAAAGLVHSRWPAHKLDIGDVREIGHNNAAISSMLATGEIARATGAAGCLDSHIQVFAHIAATGQPGHIYVVLEDDWIVVPHFKQLLLDTVLPSVPCDWDLLRLDCWGLNDAQCGGQEWCLKGAKCNSDKVVGPCWCGGSHAMVVRHETAQKVAEFYRTANGEVDCALENGLLRSYCANFNAFQWDVMSQLSDIPKGVTAEDHPYSVHAPLLSFQLYDEQRHLVSNRDDEISAQLLLHDWLRPTHSLTQFGGNIGTGCIYADKILKNKQKQFCVEGNPDLVSVLELNKQIQKAEFAIVPATFKTTQSNGIVFDTHPAKDVTAALFDCDGCACSMFESYPAFFQNLELMIVEKDARERCDYPQLLEALQKQAGLALAVDNFMHAVLIRGPSDPLSIELRRLSEDAKFVLKAEIPLVSVVMVVHERLPFVLEALKSIAAQTYPRVECVMVDDSTVPLNQNSALVEFLSAHSWVRYFHTERATIGGKRNLGVQHAKGSIVIQWDDDDYYTPSRLVRQAAPLILGQADVTLQEHRWVYMLDTNELVTMDQDQTWGPWFATACYRKSLWETQAKYPEASLAEEWIFIQSLVASGAAVGVVANELGEFVYVRHRGATTEATQGLFPNVVPVEPARIFPAATREFFARVRGTVPPGASKPPASIAPPADYDPSFMSRPFTSISPHGRLQRRVLDGGRNSYTPYTPYTPYFPYCGGRPCTYGPSRPPGSKAVVVVAPLRLCDPFYGDNAVCNCKIGTRENPEHPIYVEPTNQKVYQFHETLTVTREDVSGHIVEGSLPTETYILVDVCGYQRSDNVMLFRITAPGEYTPVTLECSDSINARGNPIFIEEGGCFEFELCHTSEYAVGEELGTYAPTVTPPPSAPSTLPTLPPSLSNPPTAGPTVATPTLANPTEGPTADAPTLAPSTAEATPTAAPVASPTVKVLSGATKISANAVACLLAAFFFVAVS